jgi:DNA-binding NtrC family response regulator
MPSALVIDGDRAISETLCQTLGLLDVSARPAYNAHAALLTLADDPPDLIFLSCLCKAGEGEGVEFLEFLQGESLLANIPVVMMAAEEELGDPERFPRSGIFAIIPRPANLRALESVLRKAGIV